MSVLLCPFLVSIALSNASSVNDAGGAGSVGRLTASFGLVWAINIPIINRSVIWWNSLHQGPSITLRGSTIDSSMLWPLGFTVLGFSLLFGSIVLMRMRAIFAQKKVE